MLRTLAEGTQANGDSHSPSISADGRYVVFWGGSTNLVEGYNGHIFIRDTKTFKTEGIVVDLNGIPVDAVGLSPTISEDGRYVAFFSGASNLVPNDTNNVWDIFLYDRQIRKITRVSVDSNGNQADSQSYLPVISSNGRYVAFSSADPNLVPSGPNGDINGWDIFVYHIVSTPTPL